MSQTWPEFDELMAKGQESSTGGIVPKNELVWRVDYEGSVMRIESRFMAEPESAQRSFESSKRATGLTFHICAAEHWTSQSHLEEYEPEQFAVDGFVHCTNDRERLIEVANLFYRADPRAYVALEIDLDAVPASAIFEDDADEFPHVYGRIPLASVNNVSAVKRGDNGVFLAIGRDPL